MKHCVIRMWLENWYQKNRQKSSLDLNQGPSRLHYKGGPVNSTMLLLKPYDHSVNLVVMTIPNEGFKVRNIGASTDSNS